MRPCWPFDASADGALVTAWQENSEKLKTSLWRGEHLGDGIGT